MDDGHTSRSGTNIRLMRPYYTSGIELTISRCSAMISGGGEIWYGDPPYYVKLIGPPGTLAGDILRLERDLPRYDCDLEIIGDDIHETERKLLLMVDDSEDVDPDLWRIAARKFPNYPLLHSTPKSILLNVQHINEK